MHQIQTAKVNKLISTIRNKRDAEKGGREHGKDNSRISYAGSVNMGKKS